MFCRCKNEKPIVIYQGDDTDFIGNPRVYLELETDLDLDGVTAKFEFLGVEKTFDVIPETKLLAVEFTKEETKTFPVGNAFASLKLTDSEGKVRTVSDDIKILVTDDVDIAYNIATESIINLSVKASYPWDEITGKPHIIASELFSGLNGLGNKFTINQIAEKLDELIALLKGE